MTINVEFLIAFVLLTRTWEFFGFPALLRRRVLSSTGHEERDGVRVREEDNLAQNSMRCRLSQTRKIERGEISQGVRLHRVIGTLDFVKEGNSLETDRQENQDFAAGVNLHVSVKNSVHHTHSFAQTGSVYSIKEGETCWTIS